MTLDQLKTFAAAAKYLCVSKAARELGVSQPWVSQRLKLLQAYVGGELYRRMGNGIELTENGQLFLQHVAPILDQFAQLNEDFPASQRIEAAARRRHFQRFSGLASGLVGSI